MTIEVALLLSFISVGFGLLSGVSNLKKSNAKEERDGASQLTMVIVKLENIGAGIADIKAEMTNVKSDVRENRDRLIKVEESSKQAHRRLDEVCKVARADEVCRDDR